MKNLVIALTLALGLIGCTSSKTSVVGTIVSVDRDRRICEFGSITIQPSGLQGGSTIKIEMSDMTEDRLNLLNSRLGEKVKIELRRVRPILGCSSSQMQITNL